jgi:hypothetical protein
MTANEDVGYTSIRVHKSVAIKLKDISTKRKLTRDVVRSAQGIIEQAINEIHKKECK